MTLQLSSLRSYSQENHLLTEGWISLYVSSASSKLLRFTAKSAINTNIIRIRPCEILHWQPKNWVDWFTESFMFESLHYHVPYCILIILPSHCPLCIYFKKLTSSLVTATFTTSCLISHMSSHLPISQCSVTCYPDHWQTFSTQHARWHPWVTYHWHIPYQWYFCPKTQTDYKKCFNPFKVGHAHQSPAWGGLTMASVGCGDLHSHYDETCCGCRMGGFKDPLHCRYRHPQQICGGAV